MYVRNKDTEKASTYVATAAKDVLPEKINIFIRERRTGAKNETSFDASVEIFFDRFSKSLSGNNYDDVNVVNTQTRIRKRCACVLSISIVLYVNPLLGGGGGGGYRVPPVRATLFGHQTIILFI